MIWFARGLGINQELSEKIKLNNKLSIHYPSIPFEIINCQIDFHLIVFRLFSFSFNYSIQRL